MAVKLKLPLFAMKRQAFQIEKPSFLIGILNFISKAKFLILKAKIFDGNTNRSIHQRCSI